MILLYVEEINMGEEQRTGETHLTGGMQRRASASFVTSKRLHCRALPCSMVLANANPSHSISRSPPGLSRGAQSHLL